LPKTIPILITVLAVAIGSFGIFFYLMQEKDNSENQEVIFQISRMNETSKTKISCNCVAFRLDDIRDQILPDSLQFRIVDWFMDREIPLTIGIIGNQFGNESSTTSVIKQHLFKHGEILEIANHGWNHESFKRFTLEEQSSFIQKTNEKIFEKLDVIPRVFIPPFNHFNEFTIQALQENGITHMSSIQSIDKPPYPLQNSKFYRFPATSTTGEFVNLEKRIWGVWSGEKTFDFIEKSISKNGFAVVMMHPLDFGQYAKPGNALDMTRIQELEFVINNIQDAGYNLVTIGKINLDS